jgi:hypothetical protein
MSGSGTVHGSGRTDGSATSGDMGGSTGSTSGRGTKSGSGDGSTTSGSASGLTDSTGR